MNRSSRLRTRSRRSAFTLIELLVVVSIIAILAALLFPAFIGVHASRVKKAAQAEMSQLQTAIESYKQTYGFYPPDNPNGSFPHPLLYELKGSVKSNTEFVALDGTVRISEGSIPGRSGLANSSVTASASDDQRAPVNFIREFKSTQFPTNMLTSSAMNVHHIHFSGTKDPWHYRSTNPTNNPGTYDLWVDIDIRGSKVRISNWRSTPEVIQ